MKLDIKPGIYILAVSGGVDSMVLLDILRQKPEVELIVAHFNHGIRPDGNEDEELVKKTTEKYGLKFEVGQGTLGLKTSEDVARKARYRFLREVGSRYQADSIITAHHQDDLIETVFINLLRGSGIRGLTAIKRNPQILRPLINMPKSEILDYAHKRDIKWREDASNQDETYLRNYVRHQLTPKLTPKQRNQLLTNIDKVAEIERQTNDIVATISHKVEKDNEISRDEFIQLPSEVADELTLYWLRELNASEPDRTTVQRLSMAIRTAQPGTVHNVRKGLWLVTERNKAHFATTVPKGLV